MNLRIATQRDYHALRVLRRQIFCDELGVQSSGYQDLYQDAFSKNVVLERGGEIIGAVRLVFNREAQEFVISYLLIKPQYRAQSALGFLLGSVVALMRINQISEVTAHSADENLAMYLAAGCQTTGPRFKKAGFTCDWTPLRFVVGAKGTAELRVAERVEPLLRASGDPYWRFTPMLRPCRCLESYAACVQALIEEKDSKAALPFLGDQRVFKDGFANSCLQPPTFLCLESNDTCRRADLRINNVELSPDNPIVVIRGSNSRVVGALYGWLTRRPVFEIDDWASIAESLPASAKTVFLIADANERDQGEATAKAMLPRVVVGIAAGTIEELSSSILRSYAEFLGPISRELSLLPEAAPGKTDIAIGTTHTVTFEPTLAIETQKMFVTLLRAGYPIGAAARFASQSHGQMRSAGCFVKGDPCLRIVPQRSRPVLEVRTELAKCFASTDENSAVYHWHSPSPLVETRFPESLGAVVESLDFKSCALPDGYHRFAFQRSNPRP